MSNVTLAFLRRLAARRISSDDEPLRAPADNDARAYFWIGFLIGTFNALALIGVLYLFAHI